MQASGGNVILFIDELHTVVGAGAAEGGSDAANLLKPALARGELRCIGATTLDEYRKHIEKDAALERRFQPVYVGEPSVEDTIAILRGLKPRYEAHHNGVKIKDSALVAAAKLSHRYITDRFLPDKAIDLVDEAASRLAMELESVPAEIDEVQRRLTQLELAARQLAEETEEHAARSAGRDRRGNRTTCKRKLASLREQWEAEKLGLGDVQKLRKQLEQSRDSNSASSNARSKKSKPAGMPVERRRLSKTLRARQPTQAAAEAARSRRPTKTPRRSRDRAAAACCARKSARTKSPKSSAPGPAFRSPACWKPNGPSCSCWKSACISASSARTKRSTAVANAVRRSRSGLQDPEPADRLVHLPRPHRRRQNRAVQGAGRSAVRRRERHGPHRHERVHGAAHRQPADRRASGLRRLRRRRPARPKPSAAGPTAWCCSTKSKRPIATCSTCCCKCSTTAA